MMNVRAGYMLLKELRTQMRGVLVSLPDYFRYCFGVAMFAAAIALGNFGVATPLHAKDAVSNSARLGGDSLRTRFVADVSKKVPFRLFTLSDPYRVIVDLPDVKFQMPAGLGDKGRGLVSAFRFGQLAPGKSRIVIDVAKSFIVEKSFIIDAANDQPSRLVIDLVPADKKRFQENQVKLRNKLRQVAKKSSSRKVGDEISKISKGVTSKAGSKPVVVIDPGHGGADPGAKSVSGLEEKKIVLDFSLKLREQLSKTGLFDVQMTRSTDVFVALTDRTKIAREKGAELFISIHADSLPRRKARGVRGATVYTLSEEASDDEAKALAARENRRDILWGMELPDEKSPLTSILIDLAQRETKNESIGFANMLLGKMKGKNRLNVKPHRSANLRVLRSPDVPSVLLELGYLSSKADEKLLKSKKWQGKVAGAIVGSVKKYFSKRVASGPQ